MSENPWQPYVVVRSVPLSDNPHDFRVRYEVLSRSPGVWVGNLGAAAWFDGMPSAREAAAGVPGASVETLDMASVFLGMNDRRNG